MCCSGQSLLKHKVVIPQSHANTSSLLIPKARTVPPNIQRHCSCVNFPFTPLHRANLFSSAEVFLFTPLGFSPTLQGKTRKLPTLPFSLLLMGNEGLLLRKRRFSGGGMHSGEDSSQYGQLTGKGCDSLVRKSLFIGKQRSPVREDQSG